MTIIYSSKPLAERHKNDFYKTPRGYVREAISKFLSVEKVIIKNAFDPGAGTGVWGEELKTIFPELFLVGVDIRDDAKFLNCESYNVKMVGDFTDENKQDNIGFDLVLGNPPFKYVHEFLDNSLSIIKDGGYVLFLLRLSFLESKRRYDQYFSNNLNPKRVWVSTRRISWLENRKTDNTAYALYLWQKGWVGNTTLDWMSWDYINE